MARFGHAASAVALMVALSTSTVGQAQSVQTDYAYDVHGRLVKVTRGSVQTEYTYDKAQNRTRVRTGQPNAAPVAYSDSLSVVAGQSASINPLANDTDANSDPLILIGAGSSVQGKGTVSYIANCAATASNCVTYTAYNGQSGQDSFTYTVSDGNGGTATGTVTVNISATAPAPTAQAITAVITPDANGNVAGYGLPLSFTGGVPTTVSLDSQPSVGTASASGTSVSYSVNGWTGQTSLQYRGANSAGTGTSATATIKVLPVVTNASSYDATPGQSTTINLASFIKTSGATLSFPSGASSANTPKGYATLSGTSLTYTPNTGSTGSDTFSYVANSSVGTSAPANITFNMSCPRLVAGPVSVTVAANSESNVVPLNITGGSPTSINYVTGTSHGSVAPLGTTMYYSTFRDNYSGPDSFTYKAANSCGESNTATATITITPAANLPPSAVNDSQTIVASTDYVGQTYVYFDPRTNDSDPDGDPLTLTGVSYAQHGGTWTNANNYVSYVPTVGWSGTDYFTYTISDGRGMTSTASVTVTVNPAPPNYAPTANPATTDPVWQSSTVTVDPRTNDTDPDGDPLTLVSIDSSYCAYGVIDGIGTCPGSLGTVNKVGNTIVYNAPFLSDIGATGSNYMAFVVWYTISDGRGHTAQSYQVFNVYGPQ